MINANCGRNESYEIESQMNEVLRERYPELTLKCKGRYLGNTQWFVEHRLSGSRAEYDRYRLARYLERQMETAEDDLQSQINEGLITYAENPEPGVIHF